MKQLSGLDATFLYFETPQTPMHVAGLTMYELPRDFEGSFHDHFKAFFATRVHLIPIFHKKLARTVFELDHPGWVDAGPLDLDYHIKPAVLPAPGSHAEMEALVGEMHSKPLDRKKPLWQFTVIDGLENGPNGEKRAALYSKVHHAAIDGGAGMVITQALYDLGPEPRKVDPPKEAKPKRIPTVPERAILGMHDVITNVVTQQFKAMEAVPKAMEQGIDAVAKLAKADPLRAVTQQLTAPKTPFNATMGRGRSYAARTVSLSGAKTIAKATGTKINDVVMAVCSGAMRSYLDKKDQLPGKPLVAFVPVSTRDASNTDLNNQVAGMNVPLATNEKDPIKRLLAIRENSGERKDIVDSVKPIAPNDFTLIGAPLLLPGLMQLYGRTKLAEILPRAVNVCISNTMGPPFPLYCAGAKVTALYPVSIATHGVGLNFTVQSYMDSLDFGLTAGKKAVPDIGVLADFLIEAFDELLAAVQVPEPAEAPKKAAKSKPARKKPTKTATAAPAKKTKPSTAKKPAKKKTANQPKS